jgi:hypothetical protein
VLDGRASRHPAGAPLSFQWSATGGPVPLRVTGDTTAMPSVEMTWPGTYTFGLRVYDRFQTSQIAEVAITVADLPPSCGVGPDRAVPTGSVTLTGWATDPNGQPIGVAWVQVQGPRPVPVVDPRALTTTFTAPADATGVYLFVLKATDGGHTTASAPLRIEVNDPPEAVAGARAGTVAPGTPVDLDGSASRDPNPEDSPLAYSWSVASGPESGELSGSDQPFARFTARRSGEYALKLTVTERANRGKHDAAVTVKVKNVAPVASAGAPREIHRESVSLDGSGSSDENGDPLTYSWSQTSGPAPLEISDPTAPKPEIRGVRPGRYTLALVVNDGHEESAPSETSVTIRNTAPAPRVIPVLTVPPGTLYLDATGTVDADGDGVRYLWRQLSGPASVRIRDPGFFRPSVVLTVPGVYVFELQVNDGVSFSFPVRTTITVGP